MGGYLLAMSLFGFKQMENLVTPRERGERKGPATNALDSVTAATVEQLGDGLTMAFRVLDSTQRAMLGLWFNMFLPFLSNYGSASSREAAWERKGEHGHPPRSESLEDASKAAMEEADKSWREDIVFRRPL